MQRCKARSKRTRKRCGNPAVRGYSVCRMRGAGGGPKTSEGNLRCKQAPLKHGFYTVESISERKQLKDSKTLSIPGDSL
jgi:hypothetical protein